MPRGGSRPGAGAPKGNMNGWRTGRHCRRAIEVIAETMRLARAGETDTLRTLWLAAFEAGALPRPRANVTGYDVPAAIQFLHPLLFDCATPTQSKRNQTQSVPAPSQPDTESETAANPVKTAGSAHIAKIQTAIKETPSVLPVPSMDPPSSPSLTADR